MTITNEEEHQDALHRFLELANHGDKTAWRPGPNGDYTAEELAAIEEVLAPILAYEAIHYPMPVKSTIRERYAALTPKTAS